MFAQCFSSGVTRQALCEAHARLAEEFTLHLFTLGAGSYYIYLFGGSHNQSDDVEFTFPNRAPNSWYIFLFPTEWEYPRTFNVGDLDEIF